MNISNITIAGGGILGSQIAFQAAYCGFNVTIWLRTDESIQRTKARIAALYTKYEKAIELMDTPAGKTKENWLPGIADQSTFNKEECLERLSKTQFHIKYTTDLKSSVQNADLLIESIIEDIDAKIDYLKKVSGFLPEHTIIVTNSSSFLPSKIAKYTGRPEKFLSLHFSNEIIRNNISEIMAHDKTDNKYFLDIMEFSKRLRMVGIPVNKENPGYIANSILIPCLFAAVNLYVKKTADFPTIDKAWKLTTGMPDGPFELIDKIGLPTAYKVASGYLKIPSFLAPYDFKGICKLLKTYIDQGKLGVQTKEGFYKYQ